MKYKLWTACLFLWIAFSPAAYSQVTGRWSEGRAREWYEKQPWLVGANYIPADAINQLEMWQAATFDPQEIDKELGWAEAAGMNTMRVFLHDLLWQQDPAGFQSRINIFLQIAAKHHIKPLFVLFDSCWEPNPQLGPQHPPIPGVHNSGWVQSPGLTALKDASQEPRLKAYVQGVIGAFAKDERILGWDIWNEPDNNNGGRFGEPKDKSTYVARLLPKAFAWAREMHPIQPLTSGVWTGNWSDPSQESEITRIQLANSDIITFHNYGWPEEFEARVHSLQSRQRPIICTEYMARGAGSTFDGVLPLAKRLHVGAINWGLVAGKTQTTLPWDSWQRPYVLEKPPVWFHDVFYPDGRPYRQAEVDLMRQLTGRGAPPPAHAP